MVTILISNAFIGAALIRGDVFIRGRHLFQCGYPKVLHLLEGGVYLFFTALKIHSMAWIVKKKNNFIFVY